MSITTALTTMMARQLEKLGYPSDDVRFSLGYCQGDGASFTGTLDIEKLGPRLVPEILPAIWSELKENADQDEELTLSRDPGRYVHERSTSLSESARSVEGTAADVYGSPTHKVAFYRFIKALEEDVVSTGAMLARMGYSLSECYIEETEDLRIFKLDRFRVELSAFKDPSYDPFESETTNEELDGRIYPAVSATLLEAFEPGPSTKLVRIWIDKDRSGRGEEAAKVLRKRLWERNIKLQVFAPPLPIPEGAKGVDWNDVLLQLGRMGFPQWARRAVA